MECESDAVQVWSKTHSSYCSYEYIDFPGTRVARHYDYMKAILYMGGMMEGSWWGLLNCGGCNQSVSIKHGFGDQY